MSTFDENPLLKRDFKMKIAVVVETEHVGLSFVVLLSQHKEDDVQK